MTAARFYRSVWRANGVLILGTCVLACLVLSYAAFEIFRDKTGRRARHSIVNVNPEDKVTEIREFGSPESIPGSSHVMVPVYSRQSYSQDYYGKETRSVRNYLFVNTGDLTSLWLLPHSRYLIASMRFHRGPGTDAHGHSSAGSGTDAVKAPVRAISYQIVKSDTNGDQRLTASDKTTLAFSGATGANYKEALGPVESILGVEQVEEDMVLVSYISDSAAHMAKVSLRDFRVVLSEKLPGAR